MRRARDQVDPLAEQLFEPGLRAQRLTQRRPCVRFDEQVDVAADGLVVYPRTKQPHTRLCAEISAADWRMMAICLGVSRMRRSLSDLSMPRPRPVWYSRCGQPG